MSKYKNEIQRRAFYRGRTNRFKPYGLNTICSACNQSKNEFHDDAACAKAWLKKCDEEAAKAREVSKP